MRTRPPLPRAMRRTELMKIRVTPSERLRIVRDARTAGISISQFFRQRALAATPSLREAAESAPTDRRREDGQMSSRLRRIRGSR